MAVEPTGAFTWGAGGAQMTPGQIAAQRKIADELIKQGLDYSPVKSWSQGASRVAQALLGGVDYRVAKNAEDANAAAERDMLSKWTGAANGTPAPDASVTSAPVSPAANPVGANLPGLQSSNVPPEKIYTNDEPSPLDPPAGADRDAAIRTIVAESGNQPPVGQQAVAAVIRNRAVAGNYGGDTAGGVVQSPNQFEPWNTAGGRANMAGIDPNSPKYKVAAAALDQAYKGDDPTNGATHFFAPKAQAQLGRPEPKWGRSGGQDIADHRFFGGKTPPPTQVAGELPTAEPPADPAALPANSQTAEGFYIPGQTQAAPATAPAARPAMSGIDPSLMQAITSPYVSDSTKRMATIIFQQQLEKQGLKPVDVGNAIVMMDGRGNEVRRIAKGEPVKGAEFGVVAKDEFGNEQYGWRDPRDKTIVPYKPQATVQPGQEGQPAPQSTIPPVPAGVDPKAWREFHTKREAAASVPATFEDTAKVRGEILGLPSYKNLAQAAPIYRSMLETAGTDSKASDLNLVYGLGKIFDPGSVVREGEMVMVKNTASLPNWLVGAANALNGGQALTPETRAAILREAHNRVTSYKTMFDQDAGMYRGIATRNRMNEADVIPNFGEFKPWEPPAKPAPGVLPPATTGVPGAVPDRAIIEQEMKRRGLLK